MSEKIIQLNEEVIKQELGDLVRDSVEKTLNELLNQEADRLTNATRYERTLDRLDGYHRLSDEILVVGCLAHVRRKFNDALKILPIRDREDSLAYIGKKYCDKLFLFERHFASLSFDERYKQRQEFAKPLLEEFYVWLSSCGVIPKSKTGMAVGYALSQKKYLERYLLDGRLEISNNRAERSVKPFVIDRKNFLFSNTPRGAKASAIMFSLIETAKENGLNPFSYLTYIFQKAPIWDIHNNLDMLNGLLPALAPDELKAAAFGCPSV